MCSAVWLLWCSLLMRISISQESLILFTVFVLCLQGVWSKQSFGFYHGWDYHKGLMSALLLSQDICGHELHLRWLKYSVSVVILNNCHPSQRLYTKSGFMFSNSPLSAKMWVSSRIFLMTLTPECIYHLRNCSDIKVLPSVLSRSRNSSPLYLFGFPMQTTPFGVVPMSWVQSKKNNPVLCCHGVIMDPNTLNSCGPVLNINSSTAEVWFSNPT